MNSNDFEWVLEITWKHKLHQCLGMSLKLVTLTQADGNVRAGWHHWTRDGENTLCMAVVGFLQSSGGFFGCGGFWLTLLSWYLADLPSLQTVVTLEQFLVLTSLPCLFPLSPCRSFTPSHSLALFPALDSLPLPLVPTCSVCILTKAALLLIFWGAFFFSPLRLSLSWGRERTYSSEMLFSGEKVLDSQQSQNEDHFLLKTNKIPLSMGLPVFFFPLKATHLRHGHHARAHGIIAWTGHIFLCGVRSWGKAV